MTESVIDLFGETPVTWPEIYAWLEAVPGIHRDSPRAPHYIRAYDVAGKVARAKREGWYSAAISRDPSHANWWTRFRWN